MFASKTLNNDKINITNNHLDEASEEITDSYLELCHSISTFYTNSSLRGCLTDCLLVYNSKVGLLHVRPQNSTLHGERGPPSVV